MDRKCSTIRASQSKHTDYEAIFMADLEGSNGQRTEFKVVGRPNVPGRLSHSLATGKAIFGSDAVVPNMLSAKFLRSPYGHAKIKSMDVGKAKALKGVVDIMTWDDPDIKAMPQNMPVPLLIDEADMEDEEIGAIVVAETEELCDEALKLINVEWEVLPHILDPRDGLKPNAPVVRVNPKGKGNNLSIQNYVQEDVEAGFKQADQIVEFDWTLALFASHMPNPNGGVAWWYENPVGVEGPTLFIEGISPTWGASQLRPMYKLTFDKLYRNTTFQGGKYCDWGIRRAALIAPLLARRTGRPVRCINKRQNDYDVATPQRYMHVKIGFKNDGTITAVHDSVVGDEGVRGTSNFTSADLGMNPFNSTRCLNLKTELRGVVTNTGRMYTTGQTQPYNWDGLPVAEQVVAEKLGMDPTEIALKNIHGPASPTTPGIPPSFQQCLEKGKKAMNWQWHTAGTKKLPDGRMHGQSFRYAMSPRHAAETYTVTVTIQGDGKVYIPLKGPWIGVYGADSCAMVVAEELGAKLEDVILSYDPKALFTPVGGGSDGTSASAWVAKEAAVACKKLLLQVAAQRFKAKPEELDTKDSTVYLKSDPGKFFPFSAFPESGDHDKDIAATYTGRPPVTTWMRGGRILENMNVTFCELAVDTETGEVEVLKYLVVCDPGKILRLTSFEGQIHQAMFFSHGSGLSEEYIFDKATGVKLHTNMFEYKKPTILDVGPVEAYAVETRSGNACYGGSGISHCMASTQLIVCAIANAIGKWIEPPATPDKILKALGKA
jgi:CO/xanthine dehydrogenase Mo-binding subunit